MGVEHYINNQRKTRKNPERVVQSQRTRQRQLRKWQTEKIFSASKTNNVGQPKRLYS